MRTHVQIVPRHTNTQQQKTNKYRTSLNAKGGTYYCDKFNPTWMETNFNEHSTNAFAQCEVVTFARSESGLHVGARNGVAQGLQPPRNMLSPKTAKAFVPFRKAMSNIKLLSHCWSHRWMLMVSKCIERLAYQWTYMHLHRYRNKPLYIHECPKITLF